MGIRKVDDNYTRFTGLCDDLLLNIWTSNPVGATVLGIHDYDDTLGDVSADAFERYGRIFGGFIEDLQSKVDPSALDAEQSLDYRVAMSLASMHSISLQRRTWASDPSLYPTVCVWGSYAILQRDFAPLGDRLKSMLGRIREIPAILETGRSNISDPCGIFVQIALDVVSGGKGFFRHVVPEAAEQSPSLKNDLLAANDSAVAAFNEYERWLRDDLLPTAEGDFAAGSRIYQQLLFSEHYLTYSPNDLVLIAEGILRDVQKEICEVAASIDPSVSWQELISRLKQEHPPAYALMSAYENAMKAARDFVIERDLVTIPANEHLQIMDTPEFERSTVPYAAYLPPAPFDADRSGQFWVTPVDRRAPIDRQMEQLFGHCIYMIPITALHEGYPGHHLQITHACDIGSPVRRQMMSSLMMEGWALYCEDMMREQGFYTDPKVQLFQLKGLLWRACRVIIDVGLHTGGMAFEDAVDMLTNTVRLERVSAVAEVKRYAMTPTQPMTYLIGKLLILDIRNRMMHRLGGNFKLKAFHDRLLGFGSIPPPLIAQHMMETPVLEKQAR
jgi:uncharacterized protein (DUF885 family)